MNDWLTSLSFHVNQPSYSLNKASSNFDLETSRSRSWVWSKGKTIQRAQYLTDLLSFCFTSIRKQFLRNSYFEIWPWKIKGQDSWETAILKFDLEKIKGQGWGQRSRSYSSPSIQPMHHLFTSHPSEQPLIPEICPIECLTLKKYIRKFGKKNFQQNSCKILSGNKHDQRDIATKFCNDWLSGSHFIMQRSNF